MKVLITCGLKSEYNEARNQLSLKELTLGSSFPRVSVKKNITLVWTGIGKVNTAINLLEAIKKYEPELVIDSGTCGTITNAFNIKDVIVSLEAQEYFSYKVPCNSFSSLTKDQCNSLLNIRLDQVCKVASLEDSVDDEYKKEVLLKNNCDCVTWESSTVFKVASQLGIKVLSIRGVTDMCNKNTFNDFKKNRLVVCKKVYNYINDVLINVI